MPKYSFEVASEITTCAKCPMEYESCTGFSYCGHLRRATIVEAQEVIAGKRIDCPLVKMEDTDATAE